jgi:hypothetical protein
MLYYLTGAAIERSATGADSSAVARLEVGG